VEDNSGTGTQTGDRPDTLYQKRQSRANYVVLGPFKGVEEPTIPEIVAGRYIKFECVLHTLTHCCPLCPRGDWE